MYISAQNDKRSIDVPITDSEIDVIASGNMTNVYTTDVVHLRPKGLPNYLLIYLEKGEAVFHFDNDVQYAHAGDIAIYRPNELQHFIYKKERALHAYWIHFDGTNVEKIMKHYQLMDIRVAECENDFVPKIIESIIHELNSSNIFSTDIANSLLLNMLARIGQQLDKSTLKTNIEDVKNYIWQNYTEDVPISVYAEKCQMSVPNFLRIFKQQIGTTPHDYKLKVRIHVSKELLTTTQNSISDISRMVGFNDQFYYSRYFKKLNGISPSKFREKYKYTQWHEIFVV